MIEPPRQLHSNRLSPLWSPEGPRWLTEAARVATLLLFALPLFLGLSRWDLRNDEAIYTYAVDRILQTGEWLTPRSLPTDDAFLEKPPLKFWLIAGAIKLGVASPDEGGMRLVDAFMGAVAFAYVFAIGRRLAGLVCGVGSVAMLFAFDPLIYEHGIRSNSMEAALVLAYCGGLYHFQRWVEIGPGRSAAHRYAVAVYFVLAFMTKFVAAAFLPMVAAIAFLWRRGSLHETGRAVRAWIGPAALAAALIAPWFVYQFAREGAGFWRVIFAEHVVARFTTSLHASHIQPADYYFRLLWDQFAYAETLTIALAGLITIAWHAWTGRPWTARLLLVWWLAPIVLMSLMTSKLVHYLYPFVPPLAIGAGWAAALAVRAIVALAARLKLSSRLAARPRLRTAAIAVAAVAIVMAVATWLNGEPLTVTWGETRVFRNSSVLRPLAIAGVLLTLAGRGPMVIGATGLAIVTMLLPIASYRERVPHVWDVDLPLHVARECVGARLASGEAQRRGLFASGPTLMGRHHEYYFLAVQPWDIGSADLVEEARDRLLTPGRQTPMLVTLAEWRQLQDTLGLVDESDNQSGPQAVVIELNAAMLLPGPFRACAAPMLAAGAERIPPASAR